jgi:uncharacterized caspase-like protein
MVRQLILAILALLAFLTTPAQAQERRLALIVANESYAGAFGPLVNPKTDAALIQGALTRAGFAPSDVVVVTDRDQRQMKRDIVEFASRLRAAGPQATGLFYFAGHGVQKPGAGSFYLIPSREEITDSLGLDLAAVNLHDEVTTTLRAAGVATLILVIDACRNAPSFARNARGLERAPPQVQGVFTLFSTDVAQVADDGKAGQASPFAAALAHTLPTPGLKISDLAQTVRRKVANQTSRHEVPTFTDGSLEDFYFVRASDRPSAMLPSMFNDYLARWGLTATDWSMMFALQLAQALINKLTAEGVK